MSVAVGKPTPIGLTCTVQDTEYSRGLPQCSRLMLQAIGNDVRVAFVTGDVASAATLRYFTVKAAQPPIELDRLVNVGTIYAASANAGAILQVMWFN